MVTDDEVEATEVKLGSVDNGILRVDGAGTSKAGWRLWNQDQCEVRMQLPRLPVRLLSGAEDDAGVF